MPHQQKVALVTGGARGIGLGVALKLAEAGFTLAISGRKVAEEIQPVPSKHFFRQSRISLHSIPLKHDFD